MIKIYIGDVSKELADYAVQHHSDSELLCSDNLEKFYSSNSGVYYTSLGDLPSDETTVYHILNCADQIEYFPPTTWSDGKRIETHFDECIQGATEIILSYFAKEKQNVIGLKYLNQHYINIGEIKNSEYDVDTRKTDTPQLWVAGCSMTLGKGVDPSQRYGTLIANKLEKPVSHLSCSGSGIPWQADQILRSDLRENDILIWGLTSENRFDYWSEIDTIRHINPSFKHSANAKANPVWMKNNIIERLLLHENTKYQAIKHILQVINFCKKSKVKLLLFGLLNSKKLSLLLNQYDFYYYYLNINNTRTFHDLGTDNLHPGPVQHQLYADYILGKLKQLNYI